MRVWLALGRKTKAKESYLLPWLLMCVLEAIALVLTCVCRVLSWR